MDEKVQRTVLENGVRILSEQMDGVRSVSVGVLVDVGPKDERPDECGYAHLLEHMLFQGTGERDASSIAEMMEIGGGAMGAFTAREYTVYHATVLDEYLTFALEVLGDMLCNSVLPEEAIERQRSVILNEIAGNADPLERANALLKTQLWPDHPLGYPTTGSEKAVQSASRNSLLSFMSRHYIANKLVVAAAGNVVHNNFVSQVRDSFWQMKSGPIAPPPSPPIPQMGTVIVDRRDVQHVYFSLAWPAPAYTSSDRYTWHVFATLLGGGPTSRLYRRLREELGLVYHISAHYQAYGNTGTVVVEGSTQPQTLVLVLAQTLIELFKICDNNINPDDHHRTVQSLVSQHLISGDSAYVRMSRLVMQELYFRRILPSEEIISGLREQSLAALHEVTQSLCATGLPTMALVGPLSEELVNAVGNMLSDFGEAPTIRLTSQPTIVAL
ncbi:MAG TPA: pitrilysin family protein [Aggregatilineaceae bacterium]|nr:pitrilysin family protein [Aggregatilineaceae bacterium]